ncbi:MAG TPA: spore coat protein U domain-containing protein [Burkholderiales bacterium]
MTTRISKLAVVLAICTAGVVSSAPAVAAGDATLTVQANVVGTCKWDTASATLNLGPLDPSSTSNATGSNSDLKFWCTKGASYSITDNGGANKTTTVATTGCGTGVTKLVNGGATDCVPYSFTATPTSGTGAGPSSLVSVTVNATISNGDYVGRTAGDYSDVVTFTITP